MTFEQQLLRYEKYIVLDVDGHYGYFHDATGLFSGYDLTEMGQIIIYLNDLLFRDLQEM